MKNSLLISVIRKKSVLKFFYNGQVRFIEPQTYGFSTTGKEILRAYQINGDTRATRMAKLFDVAKIKNLEITDEKFRTALPAHNPNDSAMTKIFAALPKCSRKD